MIHTSYKPDGYVSRALAKGYRLGFQASSDHVSTHVSYACILAEEFSRKGLVEALRNGTATPPPTTSCWMSARARPASWATKSGRANRSSTWSCSAPARSTGSMWCETAMWSTPNAPARDEARFGWEDPKPIKGAEPSYYYVRVLQTDGQMAWASPIWMQVGE